jgi:purine-binding chemotaxis protein CheW
MKLDFFSATRTVKERKLIGFELSDVVYGLDIMRVREILNPLDLQPIPGAQPFIRGVVDHRDNVLPVVCIRSLFGLPPVEQTRKSKWIVVKTPDGDVGVEVDRVTQVISVTEKQRRESKRVSMAAGRQWIDTIYQTDSGLIFELRPDDLVGSAAADVEEGRGDRDT